MKMMKTYLLFFFLSYVINSYGQPPKPAYIFSDEDQKTFHGGIDLGANISEVIGDAYHGFHKIGWYVGPMVAAKYKQFGGSIGMYYSQKGSRGVREVYSNYVGQVFEKYYLDLNYVEVPIQVLFFPDKRMFFGAGVSYSRLLKSREEAQSDIAYYFDPELYPFRRQDWCWLISGKYQFWSGWFLGARFSKSLQPVRTWDHVHPQFGSGHQTNMYFTFSVSYLVP